MAEAEKVVVEKENVLISQGDCTVVLQPAYGGKVASISVRGYELMQTPLAEVAPRTQTMSFDKGDASGWDECLPSVAECDVATEAGTAHVPDHGDLWRVEWDVVKADAASATLRGTCFSLPLELDRTIALVETAKGWRLETKYTLRNTSAHAVPWSWAAHTLYATDEGDILELPESITQLRLEGSGGNRLGKGGDTVAWPLAKLADGGTADLRVASKPDAGTGDKLFAGPLSAAENWATLLRPKAGVRIRVSFDVAATPYLGLWICYGGWPDRPGLKQICIAIEPSTAPVDSLAIDGAWSRVLGAGQSFDWIMNVDLERI
ncbi:MAG TPA: hypothetical protein VN151_13685 [Terracidiphilus sp.]|nr:hypothetical protein [Terracidiphilus sp.]